MRFDDVLALVTAIITLVLLIFTSFKIFKSSKKIKTKILLFLPTLLLALSFWYFIQFVVTFALAHVIPQSKIVNCIDLNEENCKKRPDCNVGYVDNIGGGSFCINK